jgi:hypothetical protein
MINGKFCFNVEGMKMYWWLLRHYFKLNEFMNINLCPSDGLSWTLDFKTSYDNLNEKQRKLADKFSSKLRKLDLG